jgi:hypothetical protein
MARCRYFLLKQPEPDPPLALSKPDGFHRVIPGTATRLKVVHF